MKVYLTGDKPKAQPVFIMCIAPAAVAKNQEVPADWVDDKNNPVQFNLEFNFGEAEVEDSIGKWLVEQGLAQKTRLILPHGLFS